MRHPDLSVCYFGTYRRNYARNQIMITALRSAGVTVIECHEELWLGTEDRVGAVRGGWKQPKFWVRVGKTYLRLLQQYWRIRKQYDVLVVCYPGQFDLFVARLLTWWQQKPLVWDVLMSIYLLTYEWELDKNHRAIVKVIQLAEWLACRLPDRLISDTVDYIEWLHKTHGVDKERFRLLPIGADSDLFQPLPSTKLNTKGENEPFQVLYYGTFIRNHGVKYIVEAAHLLAQDRSIHFELVGQGPERESAEALVAQHQLTNVTFIDWLDQRALLQHIARADLCLGAFGLTAQSLITVQNKIYEGLAMRKPVITGDGPAVRRVLEHGKHLYLCPRADPAALCSAIQSLKADPTWRTKLAQNGYELFRCKFTIEQTGRRFYQYLAELVKAS